MQSSVEPGADPEAGVPSKPRMRKSPQRVGKAASAIFFTLSNSIWLYFTVPGARLATEADTAGFRERGGNQAAKVRCAGAWRDTVMG